MSHGLAFHTTAPPLAALHVSDNLRKNNLGNNRGNAQQSEIAPLNHQDTGNLQGKAIPTQWFLPLTGVVGEPANGYTKEKAFLLPVTAQISRCTDESFLLQMSLQIFVAVFHTAFPFSLGTCFLFLFFLILLFNMWVKSVHLTPYYRIFLPTAAQWIPITLVWHSRPSIIWFHSFLCSLIHCFHEIHI